MTRVDIIKEIEEFLQDIKKIVVSSPFNANVEYKKIIIRKIKLHGELMWQAEQFKKNSVYHKNIDYANFISWLNENALSFYAQISLFLNEKEILYIINKKNSVKKHINMSVGEVSVAESNNRTKNYILKEGLEIPALVDLGIFTIDFKVINSKYDKYKQINRFIELIDDVFSKKSMASPITIVDFGCGKSYLTFLVYYYFNILRGIKAKIIGYDIKEDVIKNCNDIALKYGYDNLKFYVKDVTKDQIYEDTVDLVISLHACDTATDYALYYAIKHNVPNILSVPCCQHEINKSIIRGGELDIFLKHGIIKERMSALLTDAIRADILEDMGYRVDLIEIVDFAHSPKNLLIRAEIAHAPSRLNLGKIEKLIDSYKFSQKLYNLINH